MQPLLAKDRSSTAFEDLGRASVHIVHDLKNQLNGLKLYATFLRKRMEREDRPPDERETITKLIAGLDRAANDLNAIVRQAAPQALNRKHGVDLLKIITRAVEETIDASLEPPPFLTTDGLDAEPLCGEFDSAAMIEALKTLTEQALSMTRKQRPLTLSARRDDAHASPAAVIQWRNLDPIRKEVPFRPLEGVASVRMALATRIIEAHGGRVEHDKNSLRAWLPIMGPEN